MNGREADSWKETPPTGGSGIKGKIAAGRVSSVSCIGETLLAAGGAVVLQEALRD
jgi:hypothetical protein